MDRKTFIKIIPAAAFAADALGAAAQERGKTLVVYYSWSGNTRHVARRIAEFTGADTVEITPETPYPSVYRQTVDIAKKENDAQYRRPIKTKVENLAQYKTVFAGSPNWWGTISGPMRAFLAQSDISGKKIAPFMTHEGSRMGRSVEEMKTLCPKAAFLKPLAIRGGSVKSADADIKKWLGEIGF